MKEQYIKTETQVKVMAERIGASTMSRKRKGKSKNSNYEEEVSVNAHWLIEHADGNETKLSDAKFRKRYEKVDCQPEN